MAINYAAMAATATRLLRENGVRMALRRAQAQSFEPTTGVASMPSTVDLPTHGAFQVRSRFYQITGRGVGGVHRVDNILMQERTVIIDGSVVPRLNDLLVVDSQVWQILDIEEKNPAGVPIAFILTVRQ